MDLLGMNVTEEEVLEMIQEIDTTGTDEVSFSDFVRVVSKKVDTEKYQKSELLASFAKFEDGEAAGFIHKDKLTKVLLKHPMIDAETAGKMVTQMEPDRKTGLVHYKKYVNLMLS